MNGSRLTGVLLDPPASRWPDLIRTPPGDPAATKTRQALGLAASGPVVMGGHQPGAWHGGILAKWLALSELTRRTGAAAGWVVVDQSPGAGALLPYPATGDGALRRGEFAVGRTDMPPAAQPPAKPVVKSGAADRPATEAIEQALHSCMHALDRHAGARSLAEQLDGANLDLLKGVFGEGTAGACKRFCASGLHATPAFAALVGTMRQDPEACARLYNEAAAAFPGAQVRSLAVAGGTAELPLWERGASGDAPGPWRTVTSDRLPDLPDAQLVLRGIPMTGLLRRWACDLFLHGTGGGASGSGEGYDRVTERWFQSWLGERGLAPAVVASATVRLDPSAVPGLREAPSLREISQAAAEAHRAAHDPALLGDERAGAEKRELADRIEAAPRHSAERASLFARMHELRREAIARHGDRLAALEREAERLASQREAAALAEDRTWPWFLHAPETLAALQRAIAQAFDA